MIKFDLVKRKVFAPESLKVECKDRFLIYLEKLQRGLNLQKVYGEVLYFNFCVLKRHIQIFPEN
jgi:hypothetical protein